MISGPDFLVRICGPQHSHAPYCGAGASNDTELEKLKRRLPCSLSASTISPFLDRFRLLRRICGPQHSHVLCRSCEAGPAVAQPRPGCSPAGWAPASSAGLVAQAGLQPLGTGPAVGFRV
jgi:hypothetical protein